MIIESKAATPEEMRDDIVKYLKYLASQRRNEARLAYRKAANKDANIVANAYEFAADKIAAMIIKS